MKTILAMIFVGLTLGILSEQSTIIIQQSKNLDTLSAICKMLVTQDSILQAHLTCRDSSIHEELALRDTFGIEAYKWVKYFKNEFPWIKRNFDEDNKEAR